jgi:hypothetical protein
MMMGLLAGIADLEFMARLEEQNLERKRIVDKIVQQMGCSREDARQNLRWFELTSSSLGHTVH